MKVELNIDSTQMGDTLVDLFKNLTVEQKQEIAGQALTQWLKEPIEVEKSAHDGAALDHARKNSYGSKTDKELRNSSEYSSFMRNLKSTKVEMIKEVTSQVIEFHKKQIESEIKSDPQFNKVLEETMASIRENFPKFVHDAMVAYFASQMSTMAAGISTALMQGSNTENLVKNITQRLGSGY